MITHYTTTKTRKLDTTHYKPTSHMQSDCHDLVHQRLFSPILGRASQLRQNMTVSARLQTVVPERCTRARRRQP